MLCGCVLKFKLLATARIVFLYFLANIEVISIIHNRKNVFVSFYISR